MSIRKRNARRAAANELIVPAIMLLFVGIYWLEAAGLSGEALAFPSALTAIIFVTCAIIIAPLFLRSQDGNDTDDTSKNRQTGRSTPLIKTWMIVLLPILLLAVWRQVGALPGLFVYAGCILLLLGERRPLVLILVPSVLAIALVYLFKTILYVRLPEMPWAFGG